MAARTPGRSTLAKILERSSEPVYVLDAQRRIIFANSACLKWLGLDAAQCFNQRLDFCTPSPDASEAAALAGLCPPPSVFAAGVPTAFNIDRAGADGTMQRRRAYVVTLTNERDETCWWIRVSNRDEAIEQSAELSPNEAASASYEASVQPNWHARLREFIQRWGEMAACPSLFGESRAIQRVRRQVELARRHPTGIVVTGPAGTQREQLARMVYSSSNDEGSLLPLECGLLDADLLSTVVESFVRRTHAGEANRPATLLLLDVNQLTPESQGALFVSLQSAAVAVHTLATSTVDLRKVPNFSADLASLLTTMTIDIPPLAARLEDIPWIAQQLIEQANREGGHQIEGLSRDALDALIAHPWKRDVEELAEIVHTAHAACRQAWITVHDLPPIVRWAAEAEHDPPAALGVIQLDEFLGEIEAELLRRALALARGNRAKAARLLGITRSKLLRKLESPHE